MLYISQKNFLKFSILSLCLIFAVINIILIAKIHRLSKKDKSVNPPLERDLSILTEKASTQNQDLNQEQPAQINGLVIGKDNSKSLLTIRLGKQEVKTVKVLEVTKFATFFLNENGEREIIEGDFWDRIYPLRTRVTIVCADIDCSQTRNIFVNN